MDKEWISKKSLPITHFPTLWQAFIFRMWEMVPAKRLVEVLDTEEAVVIVEAERMGLDTQDISADWFVKGYITIIRAVWYILPYHQIMKLLDWTEEKLAFILKEDDFLGQKMENRKPDCAEGVYLTFLMVFQQFDFICAREKGDKAEMKRLATLEKIINCCKMEQSI